MYNNWYMDGYISSFDVHRNTNGKLILKLFIQPSEEFFYRSIEGGKTIYKTLIIAEGDDIQKAILLPRDVSFNVNDEELQEWLKDSVLLSLKIQHVKVRFIIDVKSAKKTDPIILGCKVL